MCLSQQCAEVSSIGEVDCGDCTMHGVSSSQYRENFYITLNMSHHPYNDNILQYKWSKIKTKDRRSSHEIAWITYSDRRFEMTC